MAHSQNSLFHEIQHIRLRGVLTFEWLIYILNWFKRFAENQFRATRYRKQQGRRKKVNSCTRRETKQCCSLSRKWRVLPIPLLKVSLFCVESDSGCKARISSDFTRFYNVREKNLTRFPFFEIVFIFDLRSTLITLVIAVGNARRSCTHERQINKLLFICVEQLAGLHNF